MFVGKVFTDYITDGIRPSEYLLSVIPHSVAISVGNKKNTFTDGFTDGPCAPKKKSFPLGIYYIPSVLCKYRRTTSVGKSVGDISYRPNKSVCKFVGIFIPTDYFRRWVCRWWDGIPQTLSNADGFIPSVNPCVIFFFNYLEKII